MVLELGQCNLSSYSGSLPGTLYPICGVVTECQTGVTTSALRIHTKTLREVLPPITEKGSHLLRVTGPPQSTGFTVLPSLLCHPQPPRIQAGTQQPGAECTPGRLGGA